MADDQRRLALSDPDGFIAAHGQATYDVVMKQLGLLRQKAA
jgi:hypothetical protein